ncbi:helix-turn-helix domain-containing protein [Reyranella sp. MMS21-HV4-11]|jgi:IclR family mhp operon transcriptional activator|uniref:Helix-turn-helix domain-containing protein n=1 Tax=Reyranella humidisoli TaxID=2849149 RepID=A0ABS6INU9_9HYPH|nr:helix-turn-helix domain-containing protein [Reyranella sp. MMS21-HV4-11]MBU8876282.1 helix-turn-helix domain-containing protein [Reyranella sp. MMS21-HV4-11]
MPIEPIRRSFSILEALSRRPHGTIAVLAEETGLPRPTVARLLNTLVELGYATQVSRLMGYRLTDRVLGLAQGIRFIDHFVDVAAPHMHRFTQEHGWPLYLGSISHRAITIRYSTAAESPLSFERTALQRRSPILSGALGRAWLAFSTEEERRAILRDLGVRYDAKLAAAFARIRRDGYAFAVLPRPGRLQGIAVAIRKNDRVMGCISMRFVRSAMNEAEAGARFGAPLNALARAIATDATS